MKNYSFLIILIISFYNNHLLAQAPQEFIKISGVLKSHNDNLPIPYAHIIVSGRSMGSTTNSEGKYQIIIPESYEKDTLIFRAIGFVSKKIPISFIPKEIYLKDTTYQLDNLTIETLSADSILNKSIDILIKNDYLNQSTKFEGFYRTAFKENNKFVRLFEAAIELYKENKYLQPKIIKARKSNDYRAYRWRESSNYLNSFLASDIILNPNSVLKRLQGFWEVKFEDALIIDNEELYKINILLPVDSTKERYQIHLYVNSNDYTVKRAEYTFKWNPEHFEGEAIDSTTRLNRTKVEVISTYRNYEGKIYLNYQSRHANWLIKDSTKELGRLELHDELLIYDIITINSNVKTDKQITGDIYANSGKYDKDFWGNYNKPINTKLYLSIVSDLEKFEKIEKQFKSNN